MDDEEVREHLIRAARARQFVYYSDLAKLLGIDTDNPHFAVEVGKVLRNAASAKRAESRRRPARSSSAYPPLSEEGLVE